MHPSVDHWSVTLDVFALFEGFFDPKTPLDFIGKEIVKCIELAKEGFHAVLLVLSLRNRFTPEEFAATELLQALFGAKIIDYMIVVFTGGDELEEDIETYLKDNAPPSLLVIHFSCLLNNALLV